MVLLDELAKQADPIIRCQQNRVDENTRRIASELNTATVEMRDFAFSLRNPSSESREADQMEDPTDQMRRRLDQQSQNGLNQAKAAIGGILPMIDPSPNLSIFGLDVLRGTILCRYQGARQFWINRPLGGMLDILHIPPPPSMETGQRKAVLYCNPNAGLIETTSGMSFGGGNVPSSDPNAKRDSWVDFYTSLGFHVYLFNYAGYGRSYGTTSCVRVPPHRGDQSSGCCSRLWRIFRSSLLAFQPTPDTLRADGVATAQYLINNENVQQLVVHGESIGGISASGTAKYISQLPGYRDKLSLLICDRTFCNLEAIAQRLVGGWSGYAIRGLAPLWSTDVAGDFLAASCRKVVASDANDVIISEASSLKSGIALWKELKRGLSSTKGLAWIPETPLQYRMADFDNCCVNDTRYAPTKSLFRANPPVWPNSRFISVEEAFHFAACCKRIAKAAKKATIVAKEERSDAFVHALNNSVVAQPPIVKAWISLACCDGLTGCTLGVAVKRGFDASVCWLCSAVVFGGQVVAGEAQKSGETGTIAATPGDFDLRPPAFEIQEQDGSVVFPKPIPEVVQAIMTSLELGDDTISSRRYLNITPIPLHSDAFTILFQSHMSSNSCWGYSTTFKLVSWILQH